jgi:hypothetical protein
MPLDLQKNWAESTVFPFSPSWAPQFTPVVTSCICCTFIALILTSQY